MNNTKEFILKNKEVKSFVSENNISIDKNLIPLYSYITKKNQCDKCNGLEECKQAVRGQMPTLDLVDKRVEVAFTTCAYKQQEEELAKKRSNLRTIACTFEGFDFENFEVNQARNQILSKLKSILLSYKEGKTHKGI